MKKSIDIGSVIKQSILQCVKMPNTGLYFPPLITSLCHKVGVPYDANEELIHPKHVLDNNTFLSIKCWEDNPEASTITSSSRPPRQAHARNLLMTNRLAMLESSFQDLSHRFDQFTQYQVESNTALAQMFSQCVMSLGVNISQMPPMPIFPPQPPPEPASGEDVDEAD